MTTNSLHWIADPRSKEVAAVLEWSCDICKARVKHLCTNTIRPGQPLPGRVVHYGRLIDRRKQK